MPCCMKGTMIVYFDMVKRRRPVREGGELVKLDWERKTVLKSVSLYPTAPDIHDDPNPRGNSRGGKGIVLSGEELFVGTYHSILVFDLDLNLKRTISCDLFVNIHELCLDGTDIWVSSTQIDAAILTSSAGRIKKSWWPREEPGLQARFGLTPLVLDKSRDNRLLFLQYDIACDPHHTHLNSVFKSGADTFVLLSRQGAVVQIEPEVKVVLEDSRLREAHSPVVSVAGNILCVCASRNRSILMYDLNLGRCVRQVDLLGFPEITGYLEQHPSERYCWSIYVRGLRMLTDTRVLVGISPAAILEIDVEHEKLLDFFPYSHDVGDVVHGLEWCPVSVSE
jgi:hypothetical protein